MISPEEVRNIFDTGYDIVYEGMVYRCFESARGYYIKRTKVSVLDIAEHIPSAWQEVAFKERNGSITQYMY